MKSTLFILVVLMMAAATTSQIIVPTEFVSLGSASKEVAENSGSFEITVTLSGVFTLPAPARAQVTCIPLFPPFKAVTQVVSFITESTTTVTVPITDNSDEDGDKTMFCVLATLNPTTGTTGTTLITVTIKDDDALNCDGPSGKIARHSFSPEPTCLEKNPDHTGAVEEFNCFCPEGTVFHVQTNKCINEDDCMEAPEPPKPDTQTATGSGVGDPHYRTYDGLYYDLFDHCFHIFTKDCANETFTVYSFTSNACSGGRAPTCIEKAVVSVPGLNVNLLLDGSKATFIGDDDPPPESTMRVISSSGSHTVFLYDYDVSISYSRYYLSVTVPSTYKNSMCGLLGNYDGDTKNEFMLQNGETAGLLEFELDYRVNASDFGIHDDDCRPQTPMEPEPCGEEDKTRAESFCAVLLDEEGSYASCHDIISPDRVHTDCVLDSCVCETDTCGCGTILNYAERCQAYNVTIGPPPSKCLPDCPVGRVYKVCGPRVPPTCKDQVGLREPCVAGCFCPDGFFLDKDSETCKKPEECGGFVDIPKQTETRTCTASGDPHYYTFDGAVHHFQGVCFYTFAKDCFGETFAIYSDQYRCGSTVTCIHGIVIEVEAYGENYSIELRRSQLISVPTELPVHIFQVTAHGAGHTIVIQIPHMFPDDDELTTIPVTVTYDGYTRVGVTVPDVFIGRMCGLCGNFNDNPNDDFAILGPNGTQTVTTNVAAFGISWANYELSEADDCNVEQATPAPCEGSRKKRGEEFCAVLTKIGRDSGCMKPLSPLEFINTCVFDYCAAEEVDGSINVEIACDSVFEYLGRCHQLGFETPEEKFPKECLPQCEVGQKYSICGPVVEGTCLQPYPTFGPCVDGCFCDSDKGYTLHEGICIKKEDCPAGVTFEFDSYTTTEASGGIYVVLKASGNLERDFFLQLALSEPLSESDKVETHNGTIACPCNDPQPCVGGTQCNVTFSAGEESACIFLGISDNEEVGPDRNVTLSLESTDPKVQFPGISEAKVHVKNDDGFVYVQFAQSSYNFSKGRRVHWVTLMLSAPAPEDMYVQVIVSSGSLISGIHFQGGIFEVFFKEGATMSILPVIVLPYKESLKKVAFFRLRLINVRFPELNKKSQLVRVSKELSRVIVYVNDARSTAPPPSKNDNATCFDADISADMICRRSIVALVSVRQPIMEKGGSLGFNVMVRKAYKGVIFAEEVLNLFVTPVLGCNSIRLSPGSNYLLAGHFDAQRDIIIGPAGGVIYSCTQYSGVLDGIEKAC